MTHWCHKGETSTPGETIPIWRIYECLLCVSWGRLAHWRAMAKGLPEVEDWDVLQDLIPNVGKLVFLQVPVEGWVIDSDKHGLLDSPGNTMCFPACNGKAVHIDSISGRLAVLVNGGEGSKVFPEPVPKHHSWFSDVFFLKACLGASEMV